MVAVNLFAGCGGFALGAYQAGFSVALAVDNDAILSSSYNRNIPKSKLELADISKLRGATIRELAGGRVDAVFGGPPCQGFSMIGRRIKDDPRRTLVFDFFRIISELYPSFFVMENVVGLTYRHNYEFLLSALRMVSREYQLLGPVRWDASDFGAATRRVRAFVIGIHRDLDLSLDAADVGVFKSKATTVRDAISDLDGAVYVGDQDGFDTWRITQLQRPSAYANRLRSSDGRFTGHRKTQHSREVAARFESVGQGDIDSVGRHPRLAWLGQCPTLRAGTGADRGSYQSVRPIHPDLPRVITVREAARLQGFPDNHRFHSTIWHSFRMIGNSVSPIISRAIFSAIMTKLQDKFPDLKRQAIV